LIHAQKLVKYCILAQMPPPKIQNKVGQQLVENMFEPNDKDFWRAMPII